MMSGTLNERPWEEVPDTEKIDWLTRTVIEDARLQPRLPGPCWIEVEKLAEAVRLLAKLPAIGGDT